ncbi:hypothetical protein C8Q74DRAFT_1235912 [Fomes fomentarius]|nr:hypothetical protein C8Q74DRAFT_1235912 [Fomes fomentarius]
MAVSRALACQEIVENVFEYLSAYPATLSYLARTCKSFSEPALRVLWRELDSLDPLLYLLPQCVLKADQTGRRYELIGEPNAEEWALFEAYSRRVREVNMDCVSFYDKSIQGMLFKRYNGSFLPHLKQLLHLDPSAFTTSHLEILLPSTLRKLGVRLGWFRSGESPLTIAVTVSQIASHAPLLTSLSIDTFRQVAYPSASLYPLVTLSRLRDLDISGIPMNGVTLSHLVLLPDLRTVATSIKLEASDKPLNTNDCSSNIETLQLHGSPQDLASFLCTFPLLRLCTLSLKFSSIAEQNQASEADTRTLIESIALIVSSAPKKLVELKLTCGHPYPTLPVSAVTQPTFALHALQSAVFDFRQHIDFDDDELIRMLTAWPNLTSLRVLSFPHGTPNKPFTASVLQTIALSFPQLETLELSPVDFSGLPPQKGVVRVGHPLKRLVFYALPESSEDEEVLSGLLWTRAAMYVDRLFPCADMGYATRGSLGPSGVTIVGHLRAIRGGRRIGEKLDELGVIALVGGGATLSPLAL